MPTLLARFVLIALCLLAALPAAAQVPPAPPSPSTVGQAQSGGSAMCPRLEGQLISLDRMGQDPARAEQLRRTEEAAGRQQAELDRATMQAKRMGCDSSGFFSLFSGQSAQCGPANNQIQQMRANMDQVTQTLERLRAASANPEREAQRRSLILALAQNNCGAQYVAAARAGGGFLDNLLGGNAPPPIVEGAPSGTFRTVCVRACDGYYFPISFATVQSRFPEDEKTCKNLCPASEANLFSYRNPGEDINQAVSIAGQPYSSSPNAFKYRTAFDAACSCKAAGQTWSEALKTIDEKGSLEQGDIVVTEERAKKMALPPAAKQPASAQKKGSATAPVTPPAPAAAPARAAAPAPAPTAEAAPDGSRTIRSVGPTFIPAR